MLPELPTYYEYGSELIFTHTHEDHGHKIVSPRNNWCGDTSYFRCTDLFIVEYNISNGQLSDVTGSAHVMGRYLANAIVSDKSK